MCNLTQFCIPFTYWYFLILYLRFNQNILVTTLPTLLYAKHYATSIMEITTWTISLGVLLLHSSETFWESDIDISKQSFLRLFYHITKYEEAQRNQSRTVYSILKVSCLILKTQRNSTSNNISTFNF